MGESVEGQVEPVVDPTELEPSAEPDVDVAEVPEPQPPAEETESALDRLEARLAEAQRLLSRQAELTERLHAENQTLRAGELRNAQMPLIRDLIRFCDDLERMRSVASESVDDLTLVQETLLDILARNGIESFAPEDGEPFDARLHSVAGTETTADEQLDRTVAEVVRNGFRWDTGEVVRVAEIRAYRAAAPG